jgi:hypothetical protein
MARVDVHAGVCGYRTGIRATRGAGYSVAVTIDSECPHVRKISEELSEVDALQSIGLRNGLPPVLQAAYAHCVHAACPVPSGLIKAIEVAAGLALARDVNMQISSES